MAIETQKIADGADNVAGLLRLRELDPPNFRRYRFPLLTEWSDFEGRRNDSTGYPKEFGKPNVVWVFALLKEDELLLLRAFSRYVTIHTYNKRAKAWQNFNAEMWIEPPGPDNWRDGVWLDIRVHFDQLKEIVP